MTRWGSGNVVVLLLVVEKGVCGSREDVADRGRRVVVAQGSSAILQLQRLHYRNLIYHCLTKLFFSPFPPFSGVTQTNRGGWLLS